MAQIIKFPAQASKFGYKRVRKRGQSSDDPHQLRLSFQPSATILNLESSLSSFEQALMMDERDDPRAAEFYLKAIQAEDCVADSYCNLGILQSKQGNSPGAFESFTAALKQDPRHFEAHFNLGNLYFELDDFRLARVHYQFAAAIDPVFPNVHFNLALVEAIANDFSAAVTALTTYRKLVSPDEARSAEQLLEQLRRSLATAKGSRLGSTA
ncbi:MAG: hypothetical protein C5B50_13730 [Verrucomicrobia bacterium]|nr:MAG: hypothetical protein C5B50_13730 [Verrucomicrobiota bacterium]